MRVLWAILLGGLALIGTAEARLGETLEEIEKRLGKLEFKESRYSHPGLIGGGAYDKEGFSFIVHSFYKNDGEPRRCVDIMYSKGYKFLEDITLSLKDAEKIIGENFPGVAMKIIESKTQPVIMTFIDKGGKEESVTFKEWSVHWAGPTGESADAQVFLDSEFRPVFLVGCKSARVFKEIKDSWEKEKDADPRYNKVPDDNNMGFQSVSIQPTDLISVDQFKEANPSESVAEVFPHKGERQIKGTRPDEGLFTLANQFAKLPLAIRKIIAYLYLALYYIFCSGAFVAPWIVLKIRPKGKGIMAMVTFWYATSSLYWIYLIISISMSGLLMMQAERIINMGS